VSNVVGDGMEHRNSTVMTNTRSLAYGGIENNISTVSHEFFHSWNVERIRPKSLEPFDFSKANMSGELWFAEGFTNYFDALTLCRAGIWSKEKYLDDMTNTFNKVWTSPGRQFFNPIEMSYQAPFVDAARAVDDDNRVNTFISYYIYGEMLGLALDLSLREIHLNLDDYMKLMWSNYGKQGKFYTIEDMKNTLMAYAGNAFGNKFFDEYIYDSKMPDFERLFKNVGITLELDESKVSFGADVLNQKIMNYPLMGSSAYDVGLQKEDIILKVGGFDLNSVVDMDMVLNKYKPGEMVKIVYLRYGKVKEVDVILKAWKFYKLSLMDDETTSEATIQNRNQWLHGTQ